MMSNLRLKLNLLFPEPEHGHPTDRYSYGYFEEYGNYFYIGETRKAVLVTNNVHIGCQSYTFEEFYGVGVDEALAEGLTKRSYRKLRAIVIKEMIKMEKVGT